MRTKLALAAAVSVLATACTQTLPPILPPTLTFDGTDCALTPDLAAAVSMLPSEKDQKKKIYTISSPVTGEYGCLTQNDVSGPYVVYDMPQYGTVKMIELGSALEGARIFSPIVTLLDENGEVTRLIEPKSYMFRGNIYSAQFAPAEGERFALVTVNPDLIGERYEAIRLGISTNTIYTGYGASNWYSGFETALSQGYSYEGTMQAKVYKADEEDD
uniref:hypothetical protein n=1 Tax=Parerythrobacter lutipelagi TaxID=1964208 RepID=UPI0010FA10EB|nr:hypothetical protein [Parerythrobacter lutipelagi]